MHQFVWTINAECSVANSRSCAPEAAIPDVKEVEDMLIHKLVLRVDNWPHRPPWWSSHDLSQGDASVVFYQVAWRIRCSVLWGDKDNASSPHAITVSTECRVWLDVWWEQARKVRCLRHLDLVSDNTLIRSQSKSKSRLCSLLLWLHPPLCRWSVPLTQAKKNQLLSQKLIIQNEYKFRVN